MSISDWSSDVCSSDLVFSACPNGLFASSSDFHVGAPTAVRFAAVGSTCLRCTLCRHLLCIGLARLGVPRVRRYCWWCVHWLSGRLQSPKALAADPLGTPNNAFNPKWSFPRSSVHPELPPEV